MPRKHWLPFICVFRTYEKDPEGVVHFTSTKICGRKVPRQQFNLDYPSHVNRHGDPICKIHLRYANNPDAFPSGA